MSGGSGTNQDELSLAWEEQLLAEQGDADEAVVVAQSAAIAPVDVGSDRLLSQEEVDGLLGFSLDEASLNGQHGIRAIVDSPIVSYERLPMLEIVFDRLVRLLTVNLRAFFSDNVEVTLDRLTSVRFGDYVSSIPLPAVLSVFKAEEWDNYGLVFVDSNLIYLIIDMLLGGKRSSSTVRMDGRPYTTIEINLVRRMLAIVLADSAEAFAPLSPVTFTMDRIETNPRFASITRPANAAILVTLRLDMEGRGGVIELLLPYATIEPIRELLLQSFMGEKLGRDPIWENHLATEVYQASLDLDAVLHETSLPLRQILNLKVGDTLLFEVNADPVVKLRAGDEIITEGRMGRVGQNVAVQVLAPLQRSRTTVAIFEQAVGQRRAG
jgi:flagellar motor switch protein FliM